MIGLSILLLLGVLNWEDCLNEKSAWDTLAWFAILVGLAGQLTKLGIVSWISSSVAKILRSFSLSWPAAFGVLQASFFFIHYIFASQTAHVGALYSAFLAMHLAADVPAVMSTLALAYNANLFGSLTHYSSGQSAVYFGGNCAFPPLLLNSTVFCKFACIPPHWIGTFHTCFEFGFQCQFIEQLASISISLGMTVYLIMKTIFIFVHTMK